ncbi:MAG: cytochrome P450, partial [Proteobacteria bacterium]|nr:cytochrome P450 [Pseudomonadota bacterium]
MPLPGNTLTESAQALLADPYAVYRVLRTEDPVHWSDAWDAWFLTRYDDVAAALKDPRLRVGRVSDFSRRLPAQSLRDMRPIEQKLGGWLLFLDPPEHDRLRALVSRAFTPQTIKRMEQSVRHRVERLLCDLKGTVDLLAALASPLPVMTVADMLGGDARDHDRFYGWSHDLASFLGDETLTETSVRAAEVAVEGIETYFHAVVERRRASPQDDLVSGLLAVR